MGSAEEDQKIDAFIAVTQSNRMAALRYLQKSSWNVDDAVADFSRNADQAGSGAGPSRPGPSRAAGRSRPPRATGGIASLGDLARGGGDDDSDEDNEYYAGGEKSGQVVRGGDGSRRNVDSVFERARLAGAEVGQASDLGGASEGFRSFTGRGQTLSGVTTGGHPTPAQPGQNCPLVVTIAFYENGIFTVDDGEARRVDDPENREFVMAIMNGQCPDELLPEDPNQAIDVNLVRRQGEYEPPRFKAFGGPGHKLVAEGGDVLPSPAAQEEPQEQAKAQAWHGPDTSKPLTSIQIRFADGSKLVAKFNMDQTVADVRAFVRVCRPDLGDGFRLTTTFPTKELLDTSETISAAGLANAVVVQK